MMVRVVLVAFVVMGCGSEAVPGGDDEAELPCAAPRPGCAGWEACDAGECLDIPLYECDSTTGTWVDSGLVCEGVFVSVEGDLHFEQVLVGTACGPLVARTPLALFVQDDGSVTAPPPMVVVESDASSGWESGRVLVTVEDAWGGVAATVAYDLEVQVDGEVSGGAEATTADCTGELAVTGTLCPRGAALCATDDDGWSVHCSAGVVTVDDLTRHGYCAPGSADEVCAIGGVGNLARVATCSGGCADGDPRWFATIGEYQAFDVASLCAP